MGGVKVVKVKCFRFNPEEDEEPRYETYEVPLEGAMSVMNCLLYIREKLDPSLAFIVNCHLGFCKRCMVRVNGKPCLACTTEVNGDIVVEPIRKDRVIRDLWCEGV